MIKFKARDKSGEIFNSALSTHTFPAGEANIKKTDLRDLEETEIAILQFTPESMAQDLMHLAMWDSSVTLHGKGEIKKIVVMPYVPGARDDRGIPFGANVYASIITKFAHAHQFIIFDPHSDVIVERFRAHTYPEPEITVLHPHDLLNKAALGEYDGVIAPDKGAVGRSGAVAQALGLPLYTVDKVRDFDTGKLLSFDTSNIPKEGKFLIVDDICDGGGTFLGIAEATGLPPEQLDLYVSHGVFSGKALTTLPAKFGKIITTNSFNPKRNVALDLVDFAWDDNVQKPEGWTVSGAFKRIDVIRPMLDKIQ